MDVLGRNSTVYVWRFPSGITSLGKFLLQQTDRNCIRAEQKAKLSLRHNQKLNELGTSFVRSGYETWFNEMKRTAETMALSEANMTPESTFVLFSHPTCLDQNGLPVRRNSATYVFFQ